jgi:hypothetical protein
MEIIELQDLANHLSDRFNRLFLNRQQICTNNDFGLIACTWDGLESVRLAASDFTGLDFKKLIIKKDDIFYKIALHQFFSYLNLEPL